MRIDMMILLNDREFTFASATVGYVKLQLTTDQAKALRDQITKHLRGPNRDKEVKE